MKAIVIYYSYSGNTKNIAAHIANANNRRADAQRLLFMLKKPFYIISS